MNNYPDYFCRFCGDDCNTDEDFCSTDCREEYMREKELNETHTQLPVGD